jgi:hypothetical protein
LTRLCGRKRAGKSVNIERTVGSMDIDIRDPIEDHPHQQNSLVGFTTAGTRALASQFISIYLRVPVKLFRPTRVEYVNILVVDLCETLLTSYMVGGLRV